MFAVLFLLKIINVPQCDNSSFFNSSFTIFATSSAHPNFIVVVVNSFCSSTEIVDDKNLDLKLERKMKQQNNQ